MASSRDPQKLTPLITRLRRGLLGAGVVPVLLAAGLIAGLSTFSVVDIEPGQAAVRLNNVTGGQEAVVTPGWTLRIPFVHTVHVLDAAPHSFSLQGEQDIDDLHVQRLTVR